MLIIDKTKLNKEITDKYFIVNNAFRLDKIKNAELDKYKNEPKDEINVEIGDSKQLDFLPQVKMMRWTNECNFSVRLKDEDTINTATVSTDKDTIIWEKGNIKIENYDFTEDEGGYKLIWYLKQKPLTNVVEFTIQSKGLDFFYQPELTPEEIAEGGSRPENVVGSYAVYHSTKGGMNDGNGKEYKTGKAFHIYRPHIIDANGAETWGILHIENGIYSVEIPQEFLDTAVYPIKSNDTFGYETAGGTDFTISASGVSRAAVIVDTYTATSGDTITGFSSYGRIPVSGSTMLNVAAYVYSEGVPTTRLSSLVTITLTSTSNVWSSVSGLSQAMSNGSAYCSAFAKEAGTIGYYQRYDNGTAPGRLASTDTTVGILPDPFGAVGTDSGRHYSIYATYTPSGGSAIKTWNGLAAASIKTHNGLAVASRKTFNGLA